MTTITETKTGTATITAGSTSVVISHGLATTPNLADISVTPLDDLGGRGFWPSDPTSTQFTINIASQDLTSHQFSWMISYSVDIETGPSAPVGAYCTSDDVKAFSKIAYTDLGYSSDADFVTFLDSLIAYAGSVIDEFTRVPESFYNSDGYVLTNELYDYKYPYTELRVYPFLRLPPVTLRFFPVFSIQKVEYNTQGYGLAPNWVEVTSPGYIFDYLSSQITLVTKLPAMAQLSLRISYTAGYTTTPNVIRYVCAQLCANVLQEILQRRISPITEASTMTFKVLLPAAFTPDLHQSLQCFVRRFVGVG